MEEVHDGLYWRGHPKSNTDPAFYWVLHFLFTSLLIMAPQPTGRQNKAT